MEGSYQLAVVLSLLLGGLVEVHAQNFPYISFKGEILPNNSIVILGDVGNAVDGSDSIQCHTNLSTCCSDSEGPDRGEWFFPNGLPVEEIQSDPWYISQTDQRVDLRRRDSSVILPDRIYRCDIPVDSGGIAVKASVFVGLYPGLAQAQIFLSNIIQYSEGPVIGRISSQYQFSLTCLSSIGPPTNVSWLRDGEIIVPDTAFSTSSVLVNPERATYNHILAITGRMEGLYTCVAENSVNAASEEIQLEVASGPTCFSAVPEGPTSIRMQWRSPLPNGQTTGYRIFYFRALTGHVDIIGVHNNSYLLTGLRSNASYGLRLVGLSDHLPSDGNEGLDGVHLGPGTPLITLTSITPDSISFTWSVPEGSIVDVYHVLYEGESDGFDVSGSEMITDGTTSYTITGLERFGPMEYHITLMANSTVGQPSEASVNVYTPANNGSTAADSEECEDKIDTEIAIGSIVGSFIIGLFIGIVAVIIGFCICHKLK